MEALVVLGVVLAACCGGALLLAAVRALLRAVFGGGSAHRAASEALRVDALWSDEAGAPLAALRSPVAAAPGACGRHRSVVLGGVHVDVLDFRSARPRAVLIMIPGNPGPSDFYTLFLTTVFERCGRALDIFCVSHTGHKRGVSADRRLFSLQEQVAHKVEFVRAVAQRYGSDVPVLLAGHSVGAYICLETMRALPDAAIHAAFLLFPTVQFIGDSPNGRRLWPLFRAPLRQVVQGVGALLGALPRAVTGPLLRAHLGDAGAAAAAAHLLSGAVAGNALYMAGTEMRGIRALDEALVARVGARLRCYFGRDDGWVPLDQHASLVDALRRLCGAEAARRVELDALGLRHAFVLGGSELMAARVCVWLEEEVGGFGAQ